MFSCVPVRSYCEIAYQCARSSRRSKLQKLTHSSSSVVPKRKARNLAKEKDTEAAAVALITSH